MIGRRQTQLKWRDREKYEDNGIIKFISFCGNKMPTR
jgi:hypothetical protein